MGQGFLCPSNFDLYVLVVDLSGTGAKYTAFQAAMILQKTKVVDYLVDQPSVDMTAKSTDGRNTLIIAVESKVRYAAGVRQPDAH